MLWGELGNATEPIDTRSGALFPLQLSLSGEFGPGRWIGNKVGVVRAGLPRQGCLARAYTSNVRLPKAQSTIRVHYLQNLLAEHMLSSVNP